MNNLGEHRSQRGKTQADSPGIGRTMNVLHRLTCQYFTFIPVGNKDQNAERRNAPVLWRELLGKSIL